MMLAHHEALLAVQLVAPVGLTGWAAIIGARWYSITRGARSNRNRASADTGSSVSGAR